MSQDQHFRTVVSLNGAVKYYQTPEGNSVKALDDISFSVRDNEFVTLLGPSGCGKTSLLRIISGFEQLDSGELLIGGKKMNHIAPHLRPVNTVFQSYALFPHMSVADNVGYGLDIRGVLRAERNQRVAETLELVGMRNMEKRRPSQLSGGQQQRVALARAIINRPSLLLLDEPLSALDRGLRKSMQLELKRLQAELGISFIFVTHDQEEALTMSDRIIVLNGGKVQQNDPPAAIYHTPVNHFVAGFIGEGNLIPVEVGQQEDGALSLLSEAGERWRAAADRARPVGQRLWLLLRPQYFHLSEPADERMRYARIDGTIEQLIFMGTDTEVCVRSAGGERLKALIRLSSGEGPGQLAAGQAISLWYAASACHLLPR
ncbi:ABC transporter ATP-binding protein [Affinibrenneria salicis]|uniref:Spermidine/putrescine import ATP-binding protein PotA n=1 Tax=Affinibrenneria salicis TaxID=2590031 RepID=A0A5J5G9D7_9GAMM|nr:ABC transporter ATP-binding protein [Affinibrenneria salicis]KAA9002487.1 ABC transporter ATP-binding protein [Affinibrenneria salicis]KAA9003225.1 ABC transporter ATP-binding protein [Affinibrenneria salicis]